MQYALRHLVTYTAYGNVVAGRNYTASPWSRFSYMLRLCEVDIEIEHVNYKLISLQLMLFTVTHVDS